MGYKTVENVMKYSRSKGSARLALMVLATHADDDSLECYPGRELLCQEAAMTERNLIYAMKQLETLGELKVIRGNGRGYQSHYKLSIKQPKRVQNLVIPEQESQVEKGAESGERVQELVAEKGAKFGNETDKKGAIVGDKGCKISSKRVQDLVKKGANSGFPCKEEPSGTIKEPERGAHSRRHQDFNALPFASESPETNAKSPGEQKSTADQGATSATGAVDAYLLRYPDAPIWRQEEISAADIANLAVWEITLDAWKLNRYSVRNLSGLLDNYRQRVERAQQQPTSGRAAPANKPENWRDYAPQPAHKLPNKPRTITSSFSMVNYIATRREQQLTEPQSVEPIEDLEIPF